jgi:hypothetical protein
MEVMAGRKKVVRKIPTPRSRRFKSKATKSEMHRLTGTPRAK